MAYEEIYSRYKNLYDAQNNSLAQKKDSAIQGYTNQQNDMTNQYAELANSLKAKAENTKSQYGNAQSNLLNKYNNLYTGLDQQNVKAKEENYTDRNNVDVGVNQNLNRVQELMAKNGWLGGGENLQAQLNSNSDRMNGFGRVDKTMGNTMNTILNNRNQYQANQTTESNTLASDEQNALGDINNQTIANDREKASKLQAIMDAINSANVNYGADSMALKSNLDAQAGAEVYQSQQVEAQRQYQAQQEAIAYQRQQESIAKQQAFEAQQNALSRSASRSSSSSAANSKAQLTQDTTDVNLAYRAFGEDVAAAESWINDPQTAYEIISSAGGAALYNQIKADVAARKKAANTKVYTAKPITYDQNEYINRSAYNGGKQYMS